MTSLVGDLRTEIAALVESPDGPIEPAEIVLVVAAWLRAAGAADPCLRVAAGALEREVASESGSGRETAGRG